MIVAVISLGCIALGSLVFAAVVWAGAADLPVTIPEPDDLQRLINEHHAHVLALTSEWARERERLLTAALDRDGLANLQRLERSAVARDRAVAARPDIIEQALRRQMDHQDDDQRFENVGFE